MSGREPVLIANGQGFWGDSILGPVRLVREGPLHYLTLDYLAEVTMSILQKLRSRSPDAGYATDFVRMLERILPTCKAKGIKVIANAAGVNPSACRAAVIAVVKKLGITGLKIATVEGDDILARLPELIAGGEELRNMDSGKPLAPRLADVQSANVYIGARSLADALAEGADIVIAGRVTDPSLVVAPMMHEFGWAWDDWDKLASATIAGHIVECGAQCTGGNFTRWREVPDMARIGYPIVEAYQDGSFVITKHPNTGGLVTVETVASQLLYEMGDPKRYLTPDVVADFTTIQLEPAGKDRVRVSGIRGTPATPTYKVSIAVLDGWKATGQLTIAGPEAVAKAELCAKIVWERLKLDGVGFERDEQMVELVGTNVCHAGIAAAPSEPAEVVLRLGVRSTDRAKVDRFGMEIAPLVTSGPPGVTGFAGGRPQATEVIGFWPALLKKEMVTTRVAMEEVR
ncbi:MAG: DUF1446 domain-containing protein [Planctomycetes bacterium]|nr:DUF1446 domain-containing protein [Planctomycetota bacterium]